MFEAGNGGRRGKVKERKRLEEMMGAGNEGSEGEVIERERLEILEGGNERRERRRGKEERLEKKNVRRRERRRGKEERLEKTLGGGRGGKDH